MLEEIATANIGEAGASPSSSFAASIVGSPQGGLLASKPQAIELRPYQKDCVDALAEAIQARRSALCVLPTGSGKSLILGHLMASVAASGMRALMLTHVRELVEQDAAAFERCAPDADFRAGVPLKQFPFGTMRWPKPDDVF